jgi:predicted dehydrogenase
MKKTQHRPKKKARSRKIRYAVVGLGHIAQMAVLPAFKHARNSDLTALVSDDPLKLETLGKKYRVRHRFTYAEYDRCLHSNEIDAVYIALPNDMHRDYSIRASTAGIHVLCEKPLAVTEQDCLAMIEAAEKYRTKLMTAYRLHYEAANLRAVEIARSGKIGNARIFNALFSMQVKDRDNIRLHREHGGGPLYDIGIYCINAARYLFQDEPLEVFAWSTATDEARFREVDEMSSAILRFPKDRLASFTCSFGASDVSSYRLIGTKGDLNVEPAFDYAEGLEHHLTINGRKRTQYFPKRDQFAAELIYFSDCILKNKEPEPSGVEGLADVRIICALEKSQEIGEPVRLGKFTKQKRPEPEQEIRRPPNREPEMVKTQSPREK